MKIRILGSVVSSDFLDPVPSKEGSARRGRSEIAVEITCDYGDYGDYGDYATTGAKRRRKRTESHIGSVVA